MADGNDEAKTAVAAWLDEMEGFGSRLERLLDDASVGRDLKPWLEAAWTLGAQAGAAEAWPQGFDRSFADALVARFADRAAAAGLSTTVTARQVVFVGERWTTADVTVRMTADAGQAGGYKLVLWPERLVTVEVLAPNYETNLGRPWRSRDGAAVLIYRVPTDDEARMAQTVETVGSAFDEIAASLRRPAGSAAIP